MNCELMNWLNEFVFNFNLSLVVVACSAIQPPIAHSSFIVFIPPVCGSRSSYNLSSFLNNCLIYDSIPFFQSYFINPAESTENLINSGLNEIQID